MTLSETIELNEKAMEGVTPGPWHDAPGTTTGRIVVAPNTTKAKRRVAALGGPDREANAAYLATCSPDRMREVLAAAREAEALKREIAELRDSLSDVLELAERQWANPEELSEIRRARALLSKESAEQDGSATSSTGTDEACPGEHQEVLDAIQSHNSGEDE